MSLQDSSDIHLRISRLDWATTTAFPATRDTCSAMRNSALPIGTHTTADCELLRPATCVTVHPGCAWAFRSPSSASPCLSELLYSARCWENPSSGGRLSSSLGYVLFSPYRSHVAFPPFPTAIFAAVPVWLSSTCSQRGGWRHLLFGSCTPCLVPSTGQPGFTPHSSLPAPAPTSRIVRPRALPCQIESHRHPALPLVPFCRLHRTLHPALRIGSRISPPFK